MSRDRWVSALFVSPQAEARGGHLPKVSARRSSPSDRLRSRFPTFHEEPFFFIAASWFHIHVGGFWFVAMSALSLCTGWITIRGLGRMSGIYALGVAPLLILFARTRALTMAPAGSDPSPARIYSLIRAPHHVAPFADADTFHSQWLPGCLMQIGLILLCVVIRHGAGSGRLRSMAAWAGGLSAYFLLAFGISYFDRTTGNLGKLYLFRPASLALLLNLLLALEFARTRWGWSRFWTIVILACVGPIFLVNSFWRFRSDLRWQRQFEPEKAKISAYLGGASRPDDVVLVDRAAEDDFLDFEWVARRPSLVAWKFVPTDDADMVEWYRRYLFRKGVFEHGCGRPMPYRADYLLTTPEHAVRLAGECGPVVTSTPHFVLIQLQRPPRFSRRYLGRQITPAFMRDDLDLLAAASGNPSEGMIAAVTEDRRNAGRPEY